MNNMMKEAYNVEERKRVQVINVSNRYMIFRRYILQFTNCSTQYHGPRSGETMQQYIAQMPPHSREPSTSILSCGRGSSEVVKVTQESCNVEPFSNNTFTPTVRCFARPCIRHQHQQQQKGQGMYACVVVRHPIGTNLRVN